MSQTVQRAVAIIDALAVRPRTLGEVADLLGVHRSTALRLLQTLEAAGFARRLSDGRHTVGTRLIEIAQQALDGLELRPLAHPHLRALHAACGHTVHLAQLVGDEVVYIDKLDAAAGVRMYSRVGRPASLHASGVGKAVLSRLPADRVAELLDGADLVRHTAATHADRAALEAEIARVRARGWAADDGEFEDFVNCVAAPIANSTGDVVAAVSVTALRAIAPLDRLTELVPDLLATAAAIGRDLG
ncbi:IclR family transcriptional regulator [Nocardiopsis trehalosi]|uniref:IclR family transcriptional regulator n=1 Tax=Nocardiopsis trehalosi TaxID=109329 RepID=UPI00082A813A|nr:IclR family transcriptional regulator [Nocardiopsis trehalosi]